VTEAGRTGRWAKLIAVKTVCCGGLLLFATGVLTIDGVLLWLRGSGFAWIAALGVVIAAVVFFRHRRGAGDVKETTT